MQKSDMKQLLQNLRTGDTVVVEVPIPQPRPGTALVRTAASLVSAGTERTLVEFAEKSLVGKARSRPDLARQVLDKAHREGPLTALETAFNRLDQPMVLGYSSAGTVVAVGEGLQGFHPGDRVACAGGGHAVHAEYAVVPQNLLAHLPDGVNFEAGAFTTLGAIALHGLRLSEAQVGERVAVIGLGLLGLLACELALSAGCAVFGVDLNPKRVELAQRLGVEAVERTGAELAASAFSRGQGCDAVLICADSPSNDPLELAGTIARDRAKIIALGSVGLNVPRKIYYEKELDLRVSRSYGPGRYDPSYEEEGCDYPIGFVRWTEGRNLEAVLDLMASGKLDVRPLITHRFSFEQAAEAYKLITGKNNEPYLGILLTYPQGEISSINNSTLVSVNPPLPARTRAETGEVCLGVLGAGSYAGAVFLPAVARLGGARRVGIASASGVTARHAAERFGFEFAASTENQILDNPEINTVAILTRHNEHARQTLACLRHGKNVYCEKPLALLAAEVDEIENALRTENAPLLMVGFNRRFASLAVRMRAFLDGRSEPLAANYRVNAGYLPPNHWTQDLRQGGGRILGEACHFIDFLTFLVGSTPVSVTAQALPDLGRYREDNAIMTFKFPDGSLGTVTYLANGDKSFPKERVEVYCGGRVAVLDDFRSLELVSGSNRQRIRSRLRQDKGHRSAWSAFVSAIHAGGPPPIPYEQILGVTRAALASVEALHSGNCVEVRDCQTSLPAPQS